MDSLSLKLNKRKSSDREPVARDIITLEKSAAPILFCFLYSLRKLKLRRAATGMVGKEV
jgi:hypothetical protein